uniref:Uncharacterized protein n=1 Tax=Anopheles dirus TaxID=7168 RepID=A0A182NLD8_9DIPT
MAAAEVAAPLLAPPQAIDARKPSKDEAFVATANPTFRPIEISFRTFTAATRCTRTIPIHRDCGQRWGRLLLDLDRSLLPHHSSTPHDRIDRMRPTTDCHRPKTTNRSRPNRVGITTMAMTRTWAKRKSSPTSQCRWQHPLPSIDPHL